jgi:sugar phosphate isomerase/epimerase
MINRRDFLKGSGALALGGLMLPGSAEAFSAFMKGAAKPIGIQMFTLLRLMGDDVKGTFKKLADIGFKDIETAFSPKGYYYGLKPKELKTMIEDAGMKWRSHHVMGAPFKMPDGRSLPPEYAFIASLPNLRDNYQQLVDEAAEGGLPYLVCASAPVGTLDEIKGSIDIFSKTGEACKKSKIQFAYHNHATEFDLVEGKRPYDLIMSQTDKELVKMELDLAWATKAKQNPVDLFKQYPGRFPLWHVKDIASDLNTITEIGNGVVQFKPVFENAKLSGMKHFFYEQDMAPSMDSVTTSFANLSKFI